MAEFQEGSVVRLKSGGPPMTVSIVHDYNDMLVCKWFDQRGIVQEEIFASCALVEDGDFTCEKVADVNINDADSEFEVQFEPDDGYYDIYEQYDEKDRETLWINMD